MIKLARLGFFMSILGMIGCVVFASLVMAISLGIGNELVAASLLTAFIGAIVMVYGDFNQLSQEQTGGR